MKSLVFFFLIACKLTLGFQRTDPIVTTKIGLVRGERDERGFTKFLGVPYGQVTSIFGEAIPHPNLDGIFEANDDTNVCPQVQGFAYGTLDCLNLNIYVPDTASPENPMPVMVWLHGGAFVFGSAQQARDPVTILRHDVIVVAINYRLNVYGFMCLDIPEVPGNTGLKDQLLALRWINENIEVFGGDVNQITLAGTSAGGMSANLHLLSHHEKLFNRVIIQSGTANSYWMMVESDNTIPFKIAEALNFHTTDIHEALNFLSGIDPLTVVTTANILLISSAAGINQPLVKPCVEKRFEGVNNFLVEHPMHIKSDKISTTEVIVGYTSTEFAFQLGNIGAEFFEVYDFDQHFSLGFNMSNDLNEGMELVKHFYVGDDDISENDRWELTDFGSDFIFNHPAQRMAEKLYEDGAISVYRYVFSFNGGLPTLADKTWIGTTHGEDVAYLFGRVDAETSVADLLTVDRYSTLLANFVKYGNPTPGLSELLPVVWTPITDSTESYLDINSELNVLSRPFNDRMAFWDLFYKQYGHYQKWYNSGNL